MKRVLLVFTLLLAGCTSTPSTSPPENPAASTPLALLKIAEGYSQPLLFLAAGGQQYVVEQGGRVWQVDGHRLALDVSSLVKVGSEQGLLGMAFIPGSSSDVVLSYTDTQGDTTLQHAALRAEGPALLGRVIFHLHQPFPNHNGGHVAFGPDGWLWLGLGDGGSSGDPMGNGQTPGALLGSMLRFDLQNGSIEPTIWAKGLRNPWRFSFDEPTGAIWIGDVGQDRYEEVDVASYRDTGTPNFGWNAREGKHLYPGGQPLFRAPAAEPVAEYAHTDGSCSVTGGFVYRGAAIPSYVGTYVFADYCTGHVWSLRQANGAWAMARVLEAQFNVSSFGVDEAGEMYVCDHTGGAVYRIVAA